MSASEREYFTTPEPMLAAGAVRMLRGFHDTLQSRVYNLIEDHVRKTRNPKVGEKEVYECVMQAMRELTEEHTHAAVER